MGPTTRRLLLTVVAAWVLWERVESFHPHHVSHVFWAPVEATDTRADCARLGTARVAAARQDGDRAKAYDQVQVSVVGDTVFQRVRMWDDVRVTKSTYGCLPAGTDPRTR